VEVDDLPDIQVRHGVAIGHAKGLVSDVSAHPPDPSPRLRRYPGIGEKHSPWLDPFIAVIDSVASEIDDHVGNMTAVVEEVLLDDVPLVAKTHDKVGHSVLMINLHDVPEHGPPTDFHHRFRPDNSFFGEARTQPAGQYHCFHRGHDVVTNASKTKNSSLRRSGATAASNRPCFRHFVSVPRRGTPSSATAHPPLQAANHIPRPHGRLIESHVPELMPM